MAETKSSKAKKAKPKKAAAKKPKAQAQKSAARKSPKRSGGGSKASNGASASGSGGGAAAKASRNGAGAGSTVGAVAEKAKLPLLATGAVVAGAAAVIATKSTHKQRKVLGVPVPKRSKSHLPKVGVPKVSVPKVGLPKGKGLKGDVRRAAGTVTDVAKQADQIGKRISRVANSVQAVGETTDEAAKKS
jgi:hypothetical protein